MGWEPEDEPGLDRGSRPGSGVPNPLVGPGESGNSSDGAPSIGLAGGQREPGGGRDARLSGFSKGGQWDTSTPGPELAAVLSEIGGPEWRCPEATDDEVDGILRRLAAIEAWAAAGRLGVIREKIRRDDFPRSGRSRHGDLPDEWSETVNREVSLALSLSVPSAGQMTFLAWDTAARLPGIAGLLASGGLGYVTVRLISDAWLLLSDEDAAKAEGLLLGRLAEGTVRTAGQIANLAARIAVQVDPGLAERQRKAAQKHRTRVMLLRESSGTAALCGRDLPPDETLAAYANVNARAAEYKESGAFGDARMDQYRATAYCDLLNGVPAWERITSGRLVGDDAPCDGDEGWTSSDDDGPDDSGPGWSSPDNGGPGESGHDNGSDDKAPGDVPAHRNDPGDDGPEDSGGPVANSSVPQVPGPGDSSPGDDTPSLGQPQLTDLVIPLATLLGEAERPGESHGFGVLDPALCRRLAAVAIRSPHTTVCLTVTGPDGTAIGHGCIHGHDQDATRGRVPVPPGQPPPRLAALPARISLTVVGSRLSALLTGPPRPSGSPDQSDWAITPDSHHARSPRGRPPLPGDPDWCRMWMLSMPGGLACAVRLEPVPTYECDHRFASSGYQPSGTLRHLVQVRDRCCTFPTCNRHARESDWEHAVPYDKGGKTDACNGSARSRSCHRVKQSNGWQVSQPRPGWHEWTTPSGRTYTQQPYQYPV